MKNIFRKMLLAIGAITFLLASCQKQEIRAVLTTPATSPQLTASATSVVLDSTQNADTIVNFSWGAVKYGYNADVTYTLQFDVPADSFKNPVNIIMPVNGTTTGFTDSAFNVLAYQSLRLPANVASEVQVRVKSDVNQNGVVAGPSTITSVYSNVDSISVTPYQIIIVYPELWVPGDYQGWNPATAPTIASVEANGQYQGYVYIPPGGTYQFKYTSAPDWNHINYGDDGTGTGTLSTNGSAGNLYVSGAGYYLMTADLNQMTWSATATTWSVIGDATAGGWSTDTPMTFDPTTGTWSVTTDLVSSGTFKFRANDAWTINYGYDNGVLDLNGSNIPVPSDGNYTITLNLSIAGNWSFTLKKN
jgi:starch-binding outer membrane protein SusE/F